MSNAVQHVLVSVDAQGQLRCRPDPVVVRGPNVLISFRLMSEGYAFPEQAAVVVAQPGDSFPIPAWTVNAALAVLLDRDDVAGDFAYTVNVVHVATGQRLSVDPTVRNEA